jgi:hypothetical protein
MSKKSKTIEDLNPLNYLIDFIDKISYLEFKTQTKDTIQFDTKYINLKTLDDVYDVKVQLKKFYPELKITIFNNYERVLLFIKYK